MSIADPMDTTEFRIGHTIRNLCSAVTDLDDLRRSNEARRDLQDATSLSDIELCRDRLSRILDDVGGKHNG
jgi:hypothetical protein